MGEAYLEIATFKRETSTPKAAFKLGQQQRLRPALHLLWPHLAFCCETIGYRGALHRENRET